MSDNKNTKQLFSSIENQCDEETSIYINGLGFIKSDPKTLEIMELKKASIVIGLVIIISCFMRQFLILPITYMYKVIGFNITINSATGLILASPLVGNVIKFTVYLICYSLSGFLIYNFYKKPFKFKQLLKPPKINIINAAMPICLALGFLGIALGQAFNQIGRLIHIVIPQSTYIVNGNLAKGATDMLFLLVLLPVLQELFFRGTLLYVLRKFGDDFAIIISSALFALTRNGFENMISSFFLALALSYFVIRSNNIMTAVILRVINGIFMGLCIIVNQEINTNASYIVTTIILLAVIAMAIYSFILLVKNDKRVFTIIFNKSNLTIKKKIIAYSTTFVSVIIIVMAFFFATSSLRFT